MKKTDTLAYFGSGIEVARALGLTRGAVSNWGELVPPLSAARLHDLTRGKLIFNPSDYVDYYKKRRACG